MPKRKCVNTKSELEKQNKYLNNRLDLNEF